MRSASGVDAKSQDKKAVTCVPRIHASIMERIEAVMFQDKVILVVVEAGGGLSSITSIMELTPTIQSLMGMTTNSYTI